MPQEPRDAQAFARWLEEHGLGKYAERLVAADIDFDVLRELTDADLEKLDVSLGDRKRLSQTIAEALPSAPAAAPAPAGAERRVLTVLFCDLAGSTELSRRLDPEQLRSLLACYQDACARAIAREEGTLARYVGDGLLVYFGYPRAHEDDPRRAVRAALGMVQAVRELDAALGVRIGIATGEVVVGDIGDGERRETMAVVGEAPNLAARLQALGAPGSVIAAESTWKLLGEAFAAERLGPQSLKGFAAPVPAWRIVAPKADGEAAAAQRAAPLAGRRRELEQLERVRESVQAGRCALLELRGEAGIGKSRLAREFLQRAAAAGFAVFEGQCSPRRRASAFHPFIEVLRASFGIAARDPARALEERLRAGLQDLGLEDALRPYLLNLLGAHPGDALAGLDPEVIGARTRGALLALARERCRRGPLALFLDDAHWIDVSSAELLGALRRELAASPLLLLCASRPAEPAARSRVDADTVLALGALEPDELCAHLAARLGVGSLDPALAQLLAGRSEGNPYFAEALLASLADRDELRLEGGSASLREDRPRASAIPATLAGLLMERVDRLGAEARRAAQVASVIGRSFGRALVATVAGLGAAVDVAFAELERASLVACADAGALRYRFTHAMVQEAIYESLLAADRRRLHQAIARQIESAAGPDAVQALARHYAEGDEPGKAVRYLALAGKANLRVYALDTAEAQLRRALEIAEANPGCVAAEFVLDLVLDEARILYFHGAFGRIIELASGHIARAEQSGDERRLARCLFEIGYAKVFAGHGAQGLALLERSLALAERNRDELGAAYACLGLMYYNVYWCTAGAGRRQKVLELSERALRAAMAAKDLWVASKALLGRVQEGAIWGRPDLGWEACQRLIALSREYDDPRPRQMALWGLAMLRNVTQEYAEALRAAEESRRLALSPLDRTIATAYAAWARLLGGESARGTAELQVVLRELAALQFGVQRDGLEMLYGLGMVISGRPGPGLRHIERSHARSTVRDGYLGFILELYLGEIYTQIATAKDRPTLGWLLRNAGFALLQAPFAARIAARHLGRALAAARAHDMPAHAAWCLMDFGLLELRGGRPEDARARLREARATAAAVQAHGLVARIDEALAGT